MKKIIYLIILIAATLLFSQAGAAEKSSKETAGTKKFEKSKTGSPENMKAEKTEKTENKTAQIAAGEETDAKTADEAKPEEKKKDLYFSMSTKSRVEIEKENRMNEKLFLDKISNKYFKIYEDEDNYTVVSKLPYEESDTDYKYEFKNENLLIINFKSKKNPEKEPIRYEITLPKPTEMEARKLLTRESLELVIPIDFFYEERNNMRR